MSRYVPPAEEQSAIELLRLAGYAVVRQRTYDHLREQVRQAVWEKDWQERDVEHAYAWARSCCEEERRLVGRLTRVVTAAAGLGVSIQAINSALTDEATP